MFGIKKFDAVINPPHATILAVGAGEEQAVVVDGKLDIATMMSRRCRCDHRVVDGALGADVLQAFKAYMEDPVTDAGVDDAHGPVSIFESGDACVCSL